MARKTLYEPTTPNNVVTVSPTLDSTADVIRSSSTIVTDVVPHSDKYFIFTNHNRNSPPLSINQALEEVGLTHTHAASLDRDFCHQEHGLYATFVAESE